MGKKMNQHQFLDYIYQRHSGNVKLGLERMFAVLEAMENPHEKLAGIHIAGTNGKGSTAAICEVLGQAHDLQTGLNTSPHLVEYNERIRINGIPVQYETILQTYQEWEAVFEKNKASFFEISTALAFYLFRQHFLDLSIFEVGLGGRLDGTNPFQSTVTAITSISYDHPKSLGETVEQIAAEKAGILKHQIPVVLGNIPEKALGVIKQKANEKNCPVYQLNREFRCSNIRLGRDGTTFDYFSSELTLPNVNLNLLGKHQAFNAAVAIRSFTLFMKAIGKQIDSGKIYNALQHVNWQGRMQILRKEPTVIIDGAHNQEGIETLVDNLQLLFPQKKMIFVVAILRDKKIDSIMQKLCSIAKKMYISKNKSTRAAEIEEQMAVAQRFTKASVAVDDVTKAVEIAVNEADKEDVIIVCGSLYTIAEVVGKRDMFK